METAHNQTASMTDTSEATKDAGKSNTDNAEEGTGEHLWPLLSESAFNWVILAIKSCIFAVKTAAEGHTR